MSIETALSGIIPKTIPFFGWYFRKVMGVPLLGRSVGLTNKALGRLLPHLSFLGFRKDQSFETAVRNWETYLKLVGARYELEESSSGERVYTFRQCPAGHCRPEHLDACNATMELDSSLVQNSGARLIVEKRIPLDGICVERIAPNS
jgi:hypothetical protein